MHLKKVISALLVCFILLFAVSCKGSENTKNDNSDETDNKETSVSAYSRDSFGYEKEYTKQHLDFIVSKEYKEIVAVDGGLAENIANNYEDAKLNFVNGTWKALSKAVAAVGEGEIELINEYEILVTQLMQNTGAEEGFAGSFQENYFNAVIILFEKIDQQLSAAKEANDIFTGEALEEAEELATYLDGTIGLLKKLEGVSDEEATTLFGDALEKVKEKFDSDFIKGNEKFVKNMTGALGVASDVTSFVSDTLGDVVEEYLIYQTLSTASAEWDMVWKSISKSARASASGSDDKKLIDSYNKVADCIDKILERTQNFRKSNASALFESITRNGTKNLAEFAYSAGYEVWDEMMKCWPMGAAVRGGLVAGVAAANLLANSDDIAYYGQMLIGYGRVASAAFDTMEKAQKALENKKDYKSALLFDKAFNVYKDIQMSAATCAINYLNSIKTSTLGFIFKYTTDDEEAQILLIQVHIADWMPIRCHNVQKIENNGGHVVGCNGNLFYFKLTDQSVSQTGTYGNFSANSNVKNKLICRNYEGKERTVIETNALGRLYICGEKIFYVRSDVYDWYMVNMDGTGEQLATQGEIIGYTEQYGMLLVRGDNGCYFTDFTGNRSEPFGDSESIILSVYGNFVYHADKSGEQTFVLKKTDFVSNETKNIGTVDIPECDMWYATISGITQTDTAVYFTAGEFGGTGNFFTGTGIYSISFETDVLTMLHNGFLGAPFICVETDSESKIDYVYYYEGMSISNTGPQLGFLSEEVFCINTKTLETSQANYNLTVDGEAYLKDGVLMQNTGRYSTSTLMSAQTVTAQGYKSLGIRDDLSSTYHSWAETVGDRIFVSIEDVVYEEDATLGWRTGYRRVSTALFEFSIKDKKLRKIYEY